MIFYQGCASYQKLAERRSWAAENVSAQTLSHGVLPGAGTAAAGGEGSDVPGDLEFWIWEAQV
ncbi:hypothetical protein ACF05F_33100 [Rhodococcus erythropolis]|jgi:hypothetical protein|uniref:hypothetical protein n=1 Tax=Streptomyces sp. NPDC007904 TaxID=3364787 RepID=UPI0036E96106